MSLPPPYALEVIQQTLVDTLVADDLFTGNQSANGQPIPIITEQKDDVEQAIANAIDVIGIGVLVLTPSFEFIDEAMASLQGWATLSILVTENVVINQDPEIGTLIRASTVAQRIVAVMHQRPTNLPVGPNDMTPNIMGDHTPIALIGVGPPLQYAVNFRAHIQLSTPEP